MRRPWVFTIFVALGLCLDLFSKAWVFQALATGQRLVLIGGVLQFVRAENHGVAFSLLAGHPLVIYAIRFFFIGLLGWFYWRHRHACSQFVLGCLGLLIAGALGNFLDQICHGHVRDFIDFMPSLPFVGHWAVFNFADVCITAGVLLYVVAGFFPHPKQANESSGASARALGRPDE